MNEETTDSLLDSLGDFRTGAWEDWARRVRVPVHGLARSLGVPECKVDDVFQETLLAFAKAYRDGRYDRTRGRLRAFLFGIAYRTSLAELRRSRADAQVSSGYFERLPDEREASDSWDVEWDRALLARCEDAARSEFEPATFRAYELVVHGGRTAAQAARELGVPVKSVYNAKHRVLARIRVLRRLLERAE